MKMIKYLILVGLLCTGLSPMARAALIGPDLQNLPDSGEATELAAFQTYSGFSDATICDKLDVTDPFGSAPITQGAFTYSFGQNANGQYTVTVSFDLSGTGLVVCGFGVKDGGGTIENFYRFSPTGVVSGSFTLLVPANNNNFGQLSHVSVFCCHNTSVPDSGTTAMLLGGALTGIGLARRYLKR